MHPPSANELYPKKNVDGHAHDVVGVGDAPAGTNGHEAKDEEHGRQKKRQNLQPNVYPGAARPISVELLDQNGGWDDADERDRSDDAVREDEAVVSRHVCEAIAHSCRTGQSLSTQDLAGCAYHCIASSQS